MTAPITYFKQQIISYFNKRKNYENEFHKRAAIRLEEVAKLRANNSAATCKMPKLPGMAMLTAPLDFQPVQWSQQWEQCKQEYLAAVKAATNEQYLWNDVTMFFVVGRKPIDRA